MIFGRRTRGARRAGGARPTGGFRLLSPGTLALALILALFLGGGLNLLAHHDHSLISSDNDCAACRVLETPVEATPLQAERVGMDVPRAEQPVLPTAFHLPAAPTLTLDRLRGPPRG